MRYLYLDTETVPASDRKDFWGLPAIAEGPGDIESLLAKSAAHISGLLKVNLLHFHPTYFEEVHAAESLSKKPRVSILDLAEKGKTAREDYVAGFSLDPELAAIRGLGMLFDDMESNTIYLNTTQAQEVRGLQAFWEIVDEFSPIIVGYNVIKFDLRVIISRSLILGVAPTRVLDLRRWGNPDVIDLMQMRFGTDKAKPLKRLVKEYGIEVPAGDVDGSMVAGMTDAEVVTYLDSDLVITRSLHQKLAGGYCPPVEYPEFGSEEVPF